VARLPEPTDPFVSRRWITYRGEHPQLFGDGAEVLPYGHVLERLRSEAG
jgi:hypothetical protein